MASNYTCSLTLSLKEFAYRTGVQFRGLTISQSEKGFNIVLRGLTKGRAPVYSMTTGKDPSTALESLVGVLGGKNGDQMWRKDKFYSPPLSE